LQHDEEAKNATDPSATSVVFLFVKLDISAPGVNHMQRTHDNIGGAGK
jgi:hypothetical protein